MSSAHPRIIDQDANLRALQPVGTGTQQFDENWLQQLLFAHPDLLPIADIDSTFGTLIPLAREFPVSSGYIDVLYATADGQLCLVETKLWRNPEAHRTVLAQLLDYAKDIGRLDYAEFKARIEAAASRGGQAIDLHEIIRRSLAAHDFDSVDFEANARRALAAGDFLLLIVGDRIRPEVVLLSDIMGAAPHLEFSLALIEMNFYHVQGREAWPVLAVPSVVGRSHEVTRAVVRIRYEEKRPEVEVTSLEETAVSSGRTDLEVFLKSLPSGLSDVFRTYLDRWMSGPLTVFWGKVGFSLRYRPKGKLVTLFDAYPTYLSLIKEEWVKERDIPEDAYRVYRTEISGIPEAQRTFSRRGRYSSYKDLTVEEAQTILAATDKLAQTMIAKTRQP